MKNPEKRFLLALFAALLATGVAAYSQTAAPAKAGKTAYESFYHESSARGPIRAVSTAPLGKEVSSEIMAGPTSGLDSAFLIYTRLPAGAHGPAMYTMPADHSYLVISGQMNVQIGNDKFVAGPDTAVLIPAGIPHEVWNAGSTPVAAIEAVTPPTAKSLTAMMKPAEPRKVEDAAQYIRALKLADPVRGTPAEPFISRASFPNLMSHLQERIDNAKPGAGVGPGLHVHGFDQIYFELSGSMTLNYGITTYQVPPGSFAIIQTGVVHYNKNNGVVPERHATMLLGEPEQEPFDLPVQFLPPPVRPGSQPTISQK
jgi:mannose-6-phosphate isomerase-like protein (cupin superfamily)